MIEKTTVTLFLIIYFSFQIFSQLWGTYLQTGIPSSQNYVLNFVAAMILIGFVGYYTDLRIPFFEQSRMLSPVIFVTFVLVFLYCYSRKAIENQSPKESRNEVSNGQKVLNVIILVIYGILAFIYLVQYGLVNSANLNIWTIIFTSVLLFVFYFSVIFFKGRDPNMQTKFVLALYLYPLLFLTQGVGYVNSITVFYVIFFTSVVALWGFFGVEWFVGPANNAGLLSRETCKAYLGLDDESLSRPQQTQTSENTRNINYIYVAMTLIFLSFIVAIIFTYVAIKKFIN